VPFFRVAIEVYRITGTVMPNIPLGPLFNFHEVKLVDGISRLILPGASSLEQKGTKVTKGESWA
jgi:hypothetical protein